MTMTRASAFAEVGKARGLVDFWNITGKDGEVLEELRDERGLSVTSLLEEISHACLRVFGKMKWTRGAEKTSRELVRLIVRMRPRPQKKSATRIRKLRSCRKKEGCDVKN